MKVALLLFVVALAMIPEESEAFRWRSARRSTTRSYRRVKPTLRMRDLALLQLDKNQDGILDLSEREEFTEKREALEILESLDEDGDGTGSIADCDGAHERMLRLAEMEFKYLQG